jgi:hypothetical protein
MSVKFQSISHNWKFSGQANALAVLCLTPMGQEAQIVLDPAWRLWGTEKCLPLPELKL